MMGNIETNTNTEKDEVINSIRGELNALGLNIKKEAFKAKEELKAEIKRLGFYDGDESGENIKFNIVNVRKHLESLKDKTWSDLTVKSSNLEKGVRTIAIQIAIAYINNKNGGSTNNIDLIDGIRGGNTWRGVKAFQIKYNLINKDGLPGHETITKILELLGNDKGKTEQGNDKGKAEQGNEQGNKQSIPSSNQGDTPQFAQGNTSGNEQLNATGSNVGVVIPNNPGNTDSNKSEKVKEIENLLKNKGNQNNIDNDKCINLISNKLKIVDKNDNGKNLLKLDTNGNTNGNNFGDKLKKNGDRGGIEGAIFKNSEVQDILNSIVAHQGEELKIKKQQYELKKLLEKKDKSNGESNEDSNQDKKEAIESLEDYKYANSSPESFEEFVLSDEGIAIIVNEIKSHIDTSHKNENGEYDKFYEKYPISAANLEIKLRTAWESKIQWDYYTKNGIYGNGEENGEEKKEEMEKLDVISNQITGAVDKIVGEHIKSGKGNFDQEITGLLESLLAEGTDGVPINELFSDQKYKDTFKVVLASKISNYGTFVRNKDDINLNTGDKQVDLQLKSYLYIYGSIFYSDYFKSNKDTAYYEEILPEIMKTIMSNDDTSLIDKIKHKEFWRIEQELEKKRKENDLKRRQEAAERNRKRNNLHSSARGIGGNRSSTRNTSSSDLDGTTGAEIVEKSGINLSDIKGKGNNLGEIVLNNDLAGKRAFGIAWENFKKSNRDIGIESIFTREKMADLYIIEGNDIRFNENARKEFLGSDIMRGRSQEEIDKIYNKTKSFPSEFYNILETVSSGISKQEKIMDEETKKYALGEVIDNVRDIFSNIVEKWEGNSEFEGFRFDRVDPVKREGDNIIMSGTFNGSNIKIRYDLNSGGLFINSFLQKSPGKIIIGNNTDANLPIGELDSFDTILDKNYQAPDISLISEPQVKHVGNQNVSSKNPGANRGGSPSNSGESSSDNNMRTASQSFQPPVSGIVNKNRKKIEAIKQKYEDMLYAKIDMIGDKIMENAKKQSAINSSVTKFMKTFNIITDGKEGRNIEFNDGESGSDGSDLFDFLEIISNSNPDTLDKFQLSMKELVERSGLEWGSNNVSGPQMNSKSKETFDDNNKNENISLLRECRKDFSAKSESFIHRNPVFEPGFKFGFAQIIIKNFTTENPKKPNRKLDESKMREFFTKAGIEAPF